MGAQNAEAGRSALELGSMATRDAGTGGDQVRTNSQNDDRFLNLTSNQVIVTNKTWERPSDSINGLYIRYTGAGVDGSYMDFGVTDYSLLNDWPEMPSGGTNIVRFRRGGTRGDKNIDGFAVGSGDGRPSLLVHADSGVVLGNPAEGFKGRGSINSESSYVNDVPVLVEGDYGVGVPIGPFLSDFHSVDVDNGFYSWSGNTENAPSQTGGGAIKVSRGTGATAWIAATTTGDPGQNWPRIMYKSTSADAGDYGEWEESWHTGNLKFEWNAATSTLNIITQ